jgi:uncharacterized protein (TIGR02594 family)
MTLPTQYEWLKNESGPKMLKIALELYGIRETVGQKHNPVILEWAKQLGLEKIYKDDETPWCGLFMGVLAQRAGKDNPLKSYDILRALKWAEFGKSVPVPMLGDVLVFKRSGGGHVGLYVGEDEIAYHVLGGNQGNGVNIMRLAKSRLHAARRPHYNMIPMNVRIVRLSPQGAISTNES